MTNCIKENWITLRENHASNTKTFVTLYMIFANFISTVKCNGELVTYDELTNSDLVT